MFAEALHADGLRTKVSTNCPSASPASPKCRSWWEWPVARSECLASSRFQNGEHCGKVLAELVFGIHSGQKVSPSLQALDPLVPLGHLVAVTGNASCARMLPCALRVPALIEGKEMLLLDVQEQGSSLSWKSAVHVA